MRPIWTGSISFGLVNIPVKLYLAARSERFSFRMLHEKDHGPVQFRRFCSVEEREIPYEEIVRGFEFEKGRFVVIEDEDFERLERGPVRTVDIQQFVPAEQLNPMLFESPYYLEPVKGAERAYALLREALRRSGKVGISRVVLREREYLAAVHLADEALVLSTLRYATEVRDAGSLNIPEAGLQLSEKQVDLAMLLVDQLSGDFQPESFKDDYHERVALMIQQKLEGVPAPERAPPGPPAQMVDLADVLQRSIDEAKRRAAPANAPTTLPAEGEKRAPRHAAARSTRRKKS